MSMEREVREALKPLGHPVVWGAFDRDVGFPRISLQRISTVTRYSLRGRADLETARVQVNIAAKTYGALLSLGREVSTTLTTYRGGSVIRIKELTRRDSHVETGGDVIRLQMLDVQVRYRA
ncbi:DUF3168 domain-containing protein [Tritonibacter mobilis]|uniref:DUF3168 domain-containing protein n=1 Tax=Tritonibacter mobilis TaxID=379347 RepID=UPI0008953D76|nr:DUF3168 domain-containing protein [Tritonibacter mobilis]GLP87096.1 hypothetical protein GCM10007921_26560 [Tritonibacter mobilis]SDW48637.1 Protein of unknown function [Tritonibacter mobilis]